MMHKGLLILSMAGTAMFAVPHAQAQSATSPADSLAAQVRIQGFTCATPVSATRDRKLSRPDSAVWIVKCGNANYRMRLDPNQAAKIEPLR
jgi:hypothetical protein